MLSVRIRYLIRMWLWVVSGLGNHVSRSLALGAFLRWRKQGKELYIDRDCKELCPSHDEQSKSKTTKKKRKSSLYFILDKSVTIEF